MNHRHKDQILLKKTKKKLVSEMNVFQHHCSLFPIDEGIELSYKDLPLSVKRLIQVRKLSSDMFRAHIIVNLMLALQSFN